MKVLQVLPALESGGVERGTLEIADALVREGHDSHVASAGGRLVADLEAAGSKHHTWHLGDKTPTILFQIRPFRQWLESEQFDIVHVRSRLPAWITHWALKRLPASSRPHFITTVHGLNSVSRYSGILTRGERVIAVSRTCQQYVLDNYPDTPAEKLRVIPRGIDPDYWRRDYQPSSTWLDGWHHEFPGLAGRFIVTLPGRLSRLKGHEDFLEIVERLRAEIPDIVALIVGGAAPGKERYERELRTMCRQRHLDGTVVFTGPRQDIRDIYAISDVVLSLSNKPESFGRTVLEPLAMGTPVVGYNRGGVGEILEALFPEGAVPPADTEAAANSVLSIRAGRTMEVRTNHQFLLQTMQEQTLALYREVMAS
jgi:glycosyltransferase involved in cell wall biosynthesis